MLEIPEQYTETLATLGAQEQYTFQRHWQH